MRQARYFIVFGTLAITALLAQGCATKSGAGTGHERMAQEERVGEPAIKEISPSDLGVATSRTSPSMRTELSARNATGLTVGALMDILFDFDRDSIRVDALPVVEANARRLKEDGVTRVLLEGRGDEVGTSAYNIVLGERRAKNVKSYLQQLGLSVDLKTTSYGKDRPLCFQHTNDCMQKNRSVHFVVKE
ncbi:MAG: OmpA family protein [Nitrospirae bacterium]|nr:OmpA family protein [Nitrospirota bacterium]